MVSSKANVFLLLGSDLYSKEKALESLAASSFKGFPKDIDYKVFHASDDAIGAIIDHIATSSIFSEKRLVVVKELDKMDPKGLELLIESIKKPLGSACLVLESGSYSVLKYHPVLNDIACVKRFDELEGPAVTSWVRNFVSSKAGKSISGEAMELLFELKGYEPMCLAGELDKLIAFTGDRKEIGIEDVEEAVGISALSSGFDLCWKIGARDADSAVRIVSRLLGSGKKPHEIIGMISWHLKRMLKGKELTRHGESEYEIASALKIRKSDIEVFFTQLAYFDMEEIKSGISLLLEADLDIKRTRYDPGLVLEFAVIRLCLI